MLGSESRVDRRAAPLYLVSCVGQKRKERCAARDLYTSPWFVKARAYVEARQAPWFILSAKYGLVHPDEVIEPYEATLNEMRIGARRLWADDVLRDLSPRIVPGTRVTFLAGEKYRDHLRPALEAREVEVEVPMEGLTIGRQLSWLDAQAVPAIQPAAGPRSSIGELMAEGAREPSTRREDLERFYRAFARLEQRLGGFATLGEDEGRIRREAKGVYFFFDRAEPRSDSGSGPRVVRVGTLGVSARSKSTLRQRLSNHRGSRGSGGGNHRGSVFRKLVGRALIEREGLASPHWGNGSSANRTVRASELALEQRVSDYLRELPYLWLRIDDESGPQSARARIERQSIALLSNWERSPIDAPSEHWLGLNSDKERVRRSGLWNSNHVEEEYEAGFLDEFEAWVERTG